MIDDTLRELLQHVHDRRAVVAANLIPLPDAALSYLAQHLHARLHYARFVGLSSVRPTNDRLIQSRAAEVACVSGRAGSSRAV